MRVHALRVMAVVEKTINRLDNEEKAAQMLSVYGSRHCGYGVTEDMLDLMGHSFMVSFQDEMGDEWNKECEASWNKLFRYDVHIYEIPSMILVILK